jgi:thiamine-phosphate pyrophosphorylase
MAADARRLSLNAPGTQILLIVSAADPDAAVKLDAALGATAIGCILVTEVDDPTGAAHRLVQAAQSCGVAALIEGEAELARRIGADGLQLAADEARYGQARRLLGPQASIGVAVGASRHDAMVLGELGADYVAFGGGDVAEAERDALIAWWAELFTVPCVALGVAGVEEAVRLARAGADFVALSAAWMETADPARHLVAYADAIAAVDRAQEPA